MKRKGEKNNKIIKLIVRYRYQPHPIAIHRDYSKRKEIKRHEEKMKEGDRVKKGKRKKI